jgi:ABC-2 type transport system permease protein
MNEKILLFLDMFKGFFKLLKIDYPIFRSLLELKLTLDGRRTYVNVKPGKKQNEETSLLFMSLFPNAIIGIIVGLSMLYLNSMLLALLISYGTIMMLTIMSLITDFTSVLLDTSDNTILLPRPVDSRTAAAARLVHIVIYLTLITLSIGLASMVIGTFKFGLLFLPVFLVSLFFLALLVVFFSSIFYMGLMRFTSGETFKDIILYFQVAAGIFFMGAYQLLPRVFEMTILKNLNITFEWWLFFFPPIWMAGTTEALVAAKFQTPYLICMSLTFLIPLVCIIITIRYLAPSFNRKLIQLEVSGGRKRYPAKGHSKKWNVKDGYRRLLAVMFTRSRVERFGFLLTWKLASRDRKFKLNTYPILGIFIVLVFIFLQKQDHNLLLALESISRTDKYLIFIYLPFIMLIAALDNFQKSENYKAAWVYTALPVQRPGEILSGALKSMMIKVFFLLLPLYIFILATWGIPVLDDLMLGIAVSLFFCVSVSLVSQRSFPFSRKPEMITSNVAQHIVFAAGFIAAGIFHWQVLLKYPLAVTAAAAVMFAIVALLFHFYKKTPWQKIVG